MCKTQQTILMYWVSVDIFVVISHGLTFWMTGSAGFWMYFNYLWILLFLYFTFNKSKLLLHIIKHLSIRGLLWYFYISSGIKLKSFVFYMIKLHVWPHFVDITLTLSNLNIQRMLLIMWLTCFWKGFVIYHI